MPRCFLLVLFIFFSVGFASKFLFAQEAEEQEQAQNPTEIQNPPEAKQETEVPKTAWKNYPPDIKVAKWGPEIRITVTPSKEMEKDKRLAIQSVKFETKEGQFLGLKTYGPKEEGRVAEFMLDPEVLKIEAGKITVNSSQDGDWVQEISLTPQEPEKTSEETQAEVKAEAKKPAAAPSAPSQSTEKKKFWFW